MFNGSIRYEIGPDIIGPSPGDGSSIAPDAARDTARGAARDVAVVGMACRFPGGIEGPAMFWEAVSVGYCKFTRQTSTSNESIHLWR